MVSDTSFLCSSSNLAHRSDPLVKSHTLWMLAMTLGSSAHYHHWAVTKLSKRFGL